MELGKITAIVNIDEPAVINMSTFEQSTDDEEAENEPAAEVSV